MRAERLVGRVCDPSLWPRRGGRVANATDGLRRVESVFARNPKWEYNRRRLRLQATHNYNHIGEKGTTMNLLKSLLTVSILPDPVYRARSSLGYCHGTQATFSPSLIIIHTK